MPNRLAVYFTALAALCAAVTPVLANLDTSSTIGLIGGVGALAGVVSVWLNGWQKYEERTDLESLEFLNKLGVPTDDEDPEAKAAPDRPPA